MAKSKGQSLTPGPGHGTFVAVISDLLEYGRRSAARAVNGILTAPHWEVGRRSLSSSREAAAYIFSTMQGIYSLVTTPQPLKRRGF